MFRKFIKYGIFENIEKPQKVEFLVREVRNSGRRGDFQVAGVFSRSPGLSGGNQVDD